MGKGRLARELDKTMKTTLTLIILSNYIELVGSQKENCKKFNNFLPDLSNLQLLLGMS